MENQSPIAGYGSPKVPSVSSIASMIPTNQETKKAEVQGESASTTNVQLMKAIDHAIKALQGSETILDFSIHEETKQIMVKVLEKESGKVIREIPNHKILDMVAKLWEMAGIMIDERR